METNRVRDGFGTRLGSSIDFGHDFGAILVDFGRILNGFWKDFGRILGRFLERFDFTIFSKFLGNISC